MKKRPFLFFVAISLAVMLVNFASIFSDFGPEVALAVAPGTCTPCVAEIQHCDFWHNQHKVVCADATTGTCNTVPCQ